MHAQQDKKYLCHECVGDKILKAEIKEVGSLNKCDFCGEERKAVELEKIADRVNDVYREYYGPADSYSGSGEYPKFIIAEMLESNESIAEEILAILSKKYWHEIKDGGDDYYDSTSKYEMGNIGSYDVDESWNYFCYRVKHVSRFFDADALEFLNEILKEINSYPSFGDKQVIREIKTDEDDRFIYRARRADSDEEIVKICLAPQKELGPPPVSSAIPSRMNPAGISVFYGSFDRKTCASEIRLPVGGVAVTGKFEIIRPLRILDLLALKKIYHETSWFDPNFSNVVSKINFFIKLDHEIAKPVMPGDELIDYIPTQALAEYLANHFQPKIDGIIFSSVQTGGEGQNIVLFQHASRIEEHIEVEDQLDKGKKYKTWWDEDSFTILKRSEKAKSNTWPFIDAFDFVDYHDFDAQDTREVSLRFVDESLKIMKVASIKHKTKPFRVFHFSNDKSNGDF
jgi:hypothetical protein